MYCGRCRSAAIEADGPDLRRCRECGVRLASRGPLAWLPALALAAAVCALPPAPWLLALALPALVLAIMWGESLRPTAAAIAPLPAMRRRRRSPRRSRR